MTKEERELREKMQEVKEKAKRSLKEDKLDEAEGFETEYRELRRKFDLMTSMEELPEVTEIEQRSAQKEARGVSDLSDEEVEKRYTKVFLKAVRKKSLGSDDLEVFERIKEMRAVPDATPYLQSGNDENGGLIIPEDIQTKINQYKRQFSFELQSLVSVERTSMRSGTRVFEKLADATPWPAIDEWETIPEVEAPQFEPKKYTIADYGGILPIPRQMLQDTDAALMDTIARHIARKTIITRNAKILAVLKAAYTSKEEIGSIDDLKDILDVTLDPAFLAGAKIVTNQNGYNYLNKLKDEGGDYLLQPDVTAPTGKSLLGKPVVLIPNRDLPSEDTKAPIFVGDMKEAVTLFDRGVYEIKGTDVGGDAFKRNSYDIRVIDRFDVQLWDKAAVVAGTLDTATTELP